jgi:hypothetical protein
MFEWQAFSSPYPINKIRYRLKYGRHRATNHWIISSRKSPSYICLKRHTDTSRRKHIWLREYSNDFRKRGDWYSSAAGDFLADLLLVHAIRPMLAV